MAERADRIYKRLRVRDPNNPTINYVDIPLIYRINMKAMADQAQEVTVFIDNSDQSSRVAHTHRVTNVRDPLQYVDVERVDEWRVRSMADQAQEFRYLLRNTDPPPIQPDGGHSVMHEQVHYVRYYQNNNVSTNCYIDLELIDVLKIGCAAERYQEWEWYLRHAEIGEPIDDPNVPYIVTLGYCDPTLDLIDVA